MNAPSEIVIVTNGAGRRVHGSLPRLVGRIRYAYRHRRTYIATFAEVEACRRHSYEHLSDIADAVAQASRTNWLIDRNQLEVRFFEGM